MLQKLYYLAHPYSVYKDGKEDIEAEYVNVKKSIIIANELMNLGYILYIPIVMTHFIHVDKPRPYNYWMEFDLEFMKRCDGIILSEGWEQSKGCCNEKIIFMGMNKEILYANDVLKKSRNNKEVKLAKCKRCNELKHIFSDTELCYDCYGIVCDGQPVIDG